MSKAMISQPMNGKSEEEIKKVREMAENALRHIGYDEIVDTYFEDDPPSYVKEPGLYHLGKTLVKMAECDAVYFCNGWEQYRVCQIEYAAAMNYGLKIYQG